MRTHLMLLLLLLAGCTPAPPPRPAPEPPPSFTLSLESIARELRPGDKLRAPLQLFWERGPFREVALSVSVAETERSARAAAQKLGSPPPLRVDRIEARAEPASVREEGGKANLLVAVAKDAPEAEFRIAVIATAEGMEPRRAVLFVTVTRTAPPDERPWPW